MREPRISGEQAVAAYRKTGLHPIRDEFARKEDGRLCGCPLTAVWAARLPDGWRRKRIETIEANVEIWATRLYGDQYVIAFTAAYDHGVGNLEKPCVYAEQRAIDGFNDGRAVAHAVWAAFAEVLNG